MSINCSSSATLQTNENATGSAEVGLFSTQGSAIARASSASRSISTPLACKSRATAGTSSRASRAIDEGCSDIASRGAPPHQTRIEELVQNLARLERAAAGEVDDLADRALAVDRAEHRTLQAAQVRVLT